MTLLEQRQAIEVTQLRKDLSRMEGLVEELKAANETLRQLVIALQLQVTDMKSRTGLTATIASVITVAGFIIFDVIRQKIEN